MSLHVGIVQATAISNKVVLSRLSAAMGISCLHWTFTRPGRARERLNFEELSSADLIDDG